MDAINLNLVTIKAFDNVRFRSVDWMDCPIGDNINDAKYLIEYSLSDQKRKLYFYCPTDSHYTELIKEMGGVLAYHRLHKQL